MYDRTKVIQSFVYRRTSDLFCVSLTIICANLSPKHSWHTCCNLPCRFRLLTY